MFLKYLSNMSVVWCLLYCTLFTLYCCTHLIRHGLEFNQCLSRLGNMYTFWLKLKIVSFSTWNSVKKGCSFRNFGKISLEFKFESWYTTNPLHLHHHSFSPLVSHMCYRQNLFIKSWMAADTKKMIDILLKTIDYKMNLPSPQCQRWRNKAN